MSEIAPLLAEDGIDVDKLAAPDLDTLNAAIGRAVEPSSRRAVERRNFERFTPIGQNRTAAQTILRLSAEAISDGHPDLARVVIHGLEPEPDGNKPSIAQVIGVSTGVLDTWHTDPHLRAALHGTRIPVWEKHARTAGTDILALARKGRAFDSIGGLHRQHDANLLLRRRSSVDDS